MCEPAQSRGWSWHRKGSCGCRGSVGAFVNSEGVSEIMLVILVVVSMPVSWFAQYWWGWIDGPCGERGRPSQFWGISLGCPFGGDKCPENSGGGICHPYSSRCTCMGGYWYKWRLILLPLCFPVSGVMGGMFCLWSEAGGELNCLLCASFSLRLRFTSSILENFKS